MSCPEERKEPMVSLSLRVHTKAGGRPQRLRGREDMLLYQPWQVGTAHVPRVCAQDLQGSKKVFLDSLVTAGYPCSREICFRRQFEN